ncbi:prominin-2 isoform X1 [Lepisosteus oculatus]|uniref:prominin-2 isoform X1 n=2 Tax=Lepisosteus oculatus TaxID=7918 RepID=UPI0037242F06
MAASPLSSGRREGLLLLVQLAVLLLGFCSGQNVSNACSTGQLTLRWLNSTGQVPAPSADSILGIPSNFVHSFLNLVQPNPFPKELLITVIQDPNSFTSKDSNTIQKVLKYETGFLVCIAIGILYILFVPLVGFCFACCRCCGNCGGRMYQKQDKSINYQRRGLYGATVVITAVILAGNTCMFFSNDRFTVSVNNSLWFFNNTLDNLETFLNSVPEQVSTVVNDSSVPLNKVNNSLVDIGPLLGRSIQRAVEGRLIPVLHSVLNLSQEVNDTRGTVAHLNATLPYLQKRQEELQANLTDLASRIRTTLQKKECLNCSRLESTVEKINIQMNFSGTSQLNELQSALKRAAEADLSSTIEKAQQFLGSIPQRVANESRNVVRDVQKQLQDVENQVSQVSLENLNQLVQISTNLQSVKNKANTYFPTVYKADKYRWIVGLVLCCVVLLVVVCNILGLLLGPAGLRPGVDPTKRSGTANCGGIFFMIGVGFSFLFSWLFMLLVLILFLLGGNVYTLVCKPWQSQELLQVIDTPNLIPGFNLSEALQLKTNLNISQVYKDCKNNMPLWTTLHLKQVINLDLLNISKYRAEIEESFGKTSFTPPQITLLGSDSRRQLEEFSNMSKAINLTNLTQQINYFSIEDLNSTAQDLDSLANTMANPGVKNELLSEAAALRRLSAWTLIQIMLELSDLNYTVQQLSVTTSQIPGVVNNVLVQVDEAQNFINTNTSEIAKTESEKFLDCQMGYFETYTDWARQTITQDVGRCGPVAGAVDTAEDLICAYLVDCLNAFWFSMGWCMAFLIPSIILSVKLAKFYRRMKSTDVYENHINMTHISPYPDPWVDVKR